MFLYPIHLPQIYKIQSFPLKIENWSQTSFSGQSPIVSSIVQNAKEE